MHMCKRNATSPHNRSTIANKCAISRANVCNRIGCARIVSSTGLWSEMLWDKVFVRLCACLVGPRRHAMLLQQPINGISFHRSASSRISRDHPSTARVLWMAANDRGSHFCEVEIAVVCLGSKDADATEFPLIALPSVHNSVIQPWLHNVARVDARLAIPCQHLSCCESSLTPLLSFRGSNSRNPDVANIGSTFAALS